MTAKSETRELRIETVKEDGTIHVERVEYEAIIGRNVPSRVDTDGKLVPTKEDE
jgi:hypothetical protein